MIPYEASIKYMIAGYTVIFTVLLIYLASLLVRWRNLRKDLQMLEELRKRECHKENESVL